MSEYPKQSIACGYCFRQLPIVIIEEKTVRDGRALKIQTPVVYPCPSCLQDAKNEAYREMEDRE